MCVNETEDQAVGGPIDDYVNNHVVFVDCDLVCVLPGTRATVAQKTADTREARESDTTQRVRCRP